FYDVLQPGEPPDGQRYLRQAFEHYTGALAAGDDKERAELLLLANLEIGFHEQTRLQPEILEAMDAPIYDPALLRSRLLDELFPDRPSRLRLTVAELFGRADTLIAARDRLADEAQRISRLAVTELMMTLELPVNRVLRLGKPLPDAFPPELQDIDNDALRALLAQVAPVDAGAVEDWSRLPERMRFISDLFRTYHLDAALFDPPFTTEQLAMISEGRRPDDL
ncbi:MAG: hypothetical protein KDI55_15995, partial [Anaerolineae bacterium]|nr:hypothetical protein [Anaerolineae bacterium]